MNPNTRARAVIKRCTQIALVMITLILTPSLFAQTTTCLPSCSNTDGRFLSLAGSKYKTLAGDEIAIQLAAPSGSTSIAFDIFDGETGGVWDAGSAPLVYKLFCDSTGTGIGATKIGEWQGDIMTDSAWFSIAMTHDARALAPTGRYFYILKVRIAWGDDVDAGDSEDDDEDSEAHDTWSNFKIRSTSTMATNQFSFCAPLFSVAEARIIYPSYPLLTSPTYDGTWSMYINSADALPSLEIWDGDMDYGSYNGAAMDTDDPNTTGTAVPRWSGTSAVTEGVALGTDRVRDGLGALTATVSTGSPMDDNLSAAYRRTPSVRYQIVDPNGKIFSNNNPSGNTEWERFAIGTQGSNATVDTATTYLPAGLYEVELSGMDMHNINSWRYSQGIAGVTASDVAVQMPSATCVDALGRRVVSSSQSQMGMEVWPNGSLYMWGLGTEGQLGVGSLTSSNVPVRVLKGDYAGTTYLGDGCNGVVHASSGQDHSIALLNDGSVFAWGSNTSGMLGINSTTRSSTPKRVLKGAYPGTTYLGDDPANPIALVFAGQDYSAAVTQKGQVYAWGENGVRQCGDSSTTDRLTPVKVLRGLYNGTRYLGDDPRNPIIQISGGALYTAAVAADGTVFTWGNSFAGLWCPDRVLKGVYSGTTYLGDNAANKVTQIACMDLTMLALTADGSVYSWGSNTYGQLGNGNTGTSQTVPVRVLKGAYPGTTYLGDDANNRVTSIHGGAEHAAAVSVAGRVYTWGRNASRQLGDNTTTLRNTPVLVVKGAYSGTTYLGDGAIKMDRIAVGKTCTYALSQGDNKTYAWGTGTDGRLGNGASSNSAIPVLVSQGARPLARMAIDTESLEVLGEHADTDQSFYTLDTKESAITVSGLGVYSEANQVYMTLDAIEPMLITIDLYSTTGIHLARPIDRQQFTNGKQRFGINIPAELITGNYLMKVWSDKASTAKSFILSR